MLNTRALRWVGTPALAAALLATACGSGSGNAVSDKAGTTASVGTAAENPKSGGGGDFCTVVRDQLSGLGKVFPKDFSAADQLKAYGEYLKDTNAKLMAAAPGDIRSPLEVQVRVSNAMAESYRSGVKPSPDVLKVANAGVPRCGGEGRCVR